MLNFKAIRATAVGAMMCAGAAGAATLDSVTVSDSPAGSGLGSLALAGAVIQNLTGTTPMAIEASSGGALLAGFFVSTVSTGGAPEISGFAIGAPTPGGVLLSGSVIDYEVSPDTVQVLYDITGGTVAGGWGPFAVLTIETPAAAGIPTNFVIASAAETVVPLPASALLLLSGTAGLLLLRQRG